MCVFVKDCLCYMSVCIMCLSLFVLASAAYFSSFINNLHYRGDHNIIFPLQTALRLGEQQGWNSRLDFRLRDSLTLRKASEDIPVPILL